MKSVLLIASLFGALLIMPAAAQGPETPPADKNPVTTASGLVYSILEPGEDGGRKPRFGDQVKVNYKGWLDSGESFDSSYKRGQPATFSIGGVIEGWNEGLGYVAKGGKIKLVIPANLAYGDREIPGIPANSRLTFYVELLDVTPGDVPDFQSVQKEGVETQKTDAGIVWRLETPGTGENCAADQTAVFELVCWTTDGKTVLARTTGSGGALTGAASAFALPFLKVALPTLKKGGIGWYEVPDGQGFLKGQAPPAIDGKTAIYRIKLVDLMPPAPKFRQLDPAKTQKTTSGLKYEILKAGEGANPTASSTVACRYAGWLATDGKMFDASFNRGPAPTEFPLNGVIKGWTEGVQLMKPGAQFLFEIPAELAYGERGAGRDIPPGATLIFYIELVEVK